jgi:hypothetical protein
MRYYPAFDAKSGFNARFKRVLTPNPWNLDFSTCLRLFLVMINFFRKTALSPD